MAALRVVEKRLDEIGLGDYPRDALTKSKQTEY